MHRAGRALALCRFVGGKGAERNGIAGHGAQLRRCYLLGREVAFRAFLARFAAPKERGWELPARGLGAGGAQRGVLCPVVAKGLQLRGWQGKAGDEQLPSLMQAATLP